MKTGEIFFESGTELTSENAEVLLTSSVPSFRIVDANKDFHSMLLLNTIEKRQRRLGRAPNSFFR